MLATPRLIAGGGFQGCDALDQAGVARIKGLDQLLPPVAAWLGTAATVAAISVPHQCPRAGPVWGEGDILMGGAGSAPFPRQPGRPDEASLKARSGRPGLDERAPRRARRRGRLHGVRIEVVLGDITTQNVEAVVTAANSALRGGGGVDGAVHRAAGPQLVRASRALAPCPPGSAVVTPAYDLATAQWVIHAVGPIYAGPQDAQVLASAYTSSLARCDEVGARSVGFPAISTGAYGYPPEAAARVSVAALVSARTNVQQCLLVAFDDSSAELWADALGNR